PRSVDLNDVSGPYRAPDLRIKDMQSAAGVQGRGRIGSYLSIDLGGGGDEARSSRSGRNRYLRSRVPGSPGAGVESGRAVRERERKRCVTIRECSDDLPVCNRAAAIIKETDFERRRPRCRCREITDKPRLSGNQLRGGTSRGCIERRLAVTARS